MNLHIELDATHPAYAWLEQQADKIGARGHFGTHIDCYTSVPEHGELCLPVHILDCRQQMPSMDEVRQLPSLQEQALILYTGNMHRNDYGSPAYFDQTDTTVDREVLLQILERAPRLLLIDSYGIGNHGSNHRELDMICEAAGCHVVENIRIAPEEVAAIREIRVCFDLEYPSTGKPCTVTY